MKAIIITAIIIALMVVALTARDSVEYIRETEEVIVEVKPEWAQDEDAVKAAQNVIRRKELQTELATLKDERGKLTARITEVEKELGTY
jgi:predicted  nucleic acid-binding Zn-ribbon protein